MVVFIFGLQNRIFIHENGSDGYSILIVVGLEIRLTVQGSCKMGNSFDALFWGTIFKSIRAPFLLFFWVF